MFIQCGQACMQVITSQGMYQRSKGYTVTREMYQVYIPVGPIDIQLYHDIYIIYIIYKIYIYIYIYNYILYIRFHPITLMIVLLNLEWS